LGFLSVCVRVNAGVEVLANKIENGSYIEVGFGRALYEFSSDVASIFRAFRLVDLAYLMILLHKII
jgi:hypothetical protein